MTIEQIIADLGLNVTANFIYDLVKQFFARTPIPTTDGLRDYLASHLSISGVRIEAARLIDFLARNGDITITGSDIRAGERITMASAPGTELRFGHDSAARTDKTAIVAGPGAEIRAQGGAKIVQNPDGSIDFYT